MSKKRSSRSKGPENPYRSYIFEVAAWEPYYSYSLNDGRLHPGPYREHLELGLVGQGLALAKAAGRTVELTFFGSREEAQFLKDPPRSDWKPLCVGTITLRGERADFLGSIPVDALWGVVAALPSGTLRFVDMYGEPLIRGTAKIRSITFCRDIDPDDLEFAREQS
jgi:hypothetical protein